MAVLPRMPAVRAAMPAFMAQQNWGKKGKHCSFPVTEGREGREVLFWDADKDLRVAGVSFRGWRKRD